MRADGSYLPPIAETIYVPRIWRPRTAAGNFDVTLRRDSRKSVGLHLSASGVRIPAPLLRFYVGEAEIREAIRFPDRGGLGTGFLLAENTDVRLVVEQDGKRIAEIVLRP